MSTIDASDIDRMVRKLRNLEAGRTLRPHVMRYFERAGETVLNNLRVWSPVKTGRLRTSLAKGAPEGLWRISGFPVPKQLRIGTNVKHRGESYPRILDKSPIHTYARGPREGQLTQGWFSKSKDRTRRSLNKLRDILGADIVQELAK